MDSWIYAAAWRLHALGYLDDVFLGMRPWTRASVWRMMEEAGARLDTAGAGNTVVAAEARGIHDAINYELLSDVEGPCRAARGEVRMESVYSVSRIMSGTTL
ncbi:MAG TPA: capsule assembly Wzi family protein, partial [Candidatus Dormibacteraeota bacterium]|nr:capsule assembly Wzi family protein [Candidatus Dormibacteraeota bacterium]